MSRLELLVPGGAGQLGSELAASADDGLGVNAPGSDELDVTQPGAVLDVVTDLVARARNNEGSPAVINAAAYTAVDEAESDEDRAFAVNVDAPRVLAAVCSSRNVPLIHVSTDYVFDGEASRPYEPTDPLGPRSAYGRTKAAGEDAVLGSGASAVVVRTAWVYGARGGNFVKTMARLLRDRETVSVVDDQHGSPTLASDLAAGLIELAGSIVDGTVAANQILHCAGAGAATRYSFARAIFTELGADPNRVKPCSAADFPRPAARPAYSVLSNASWVSAGLRQLRPWDEALSEFIEQNGADL